MPGQISGRHKNDRYHSIQSCLTQRFFAVRLADYGIAVNEPAEHNKKGIPHKKYPRGDESPVTHFLSNCYSTLREASPILETTAATSALVMVCHGLNPVPSPVRTPAS